MQAFAGVTFSLALSYNRLVFTTADLQEIGRNHSGATVGRLIFRDRRSTLELFFRADFMAGAAL